jgi:hypothetical protein
MEHRHLVGDTLSLAAIDDISGSFAYSSTTRRISSARAASSASVRCEPRPSSTRSRGRDQEARKRLR